MIAPIESLSKTTRIRNLGVVTVASEHDPSVKPNVTEKTWQTATQWVKKHPTASIVASVVLGLLVGYAEDSFIVFGRSAK